MNNTFSFYNFEVKLNEVYDDSSILFGSLGLSNNYHFYSIDRTETIYEDFNPVTKSYAGIVMTLDNQVSQYSRTSYSFWDMLGYIGGIYGLLKTIGYFVFKFFINRIFYSTIVSELYCFNSEQQNDKFENIQNIENQSNLGKSDFSK